MSNVNIMNTYINKRDITIFDTLANISRYFKLVYKIGKKDIIYTMYKKI